jgi:hypothetical protein
MNLDFKIRKKFLWITAQSQDENRVGGERPCRACLNRLFSHATFVFALKVPENSAFDYR